MAPRLRRMKPYHPRRRRTKAEMSMQGGAQGVALYKQAIHDIKHQISSKVGNLIISVEEKNTTLIPKMQLETKTYLMKHGDEMRKLAEKIGDGIVTAVRDYLDSVDGLLHTNPNWIDQAKISKCYHAEETLEKHLKAA